MRDASSRLFQSLFDAYDPEWDGAEDLGAVVEVGLIVWDNVYTKKYSDIKTLSANTFCVCAFSKIFQWMDGCIFSHAMQLQ